MKARQWRTKNKLNLDQMAEKLGYHKSYVCKVENGKKAPSGRIIYEYDRVTKGEVSSSDWNEAFQ